MAGRAPWAVLAPAFPSRGTLGAVPTPAESHRAELGELWAAGLTAASLKVLWP